MQRVLTYKACEPQPQESTSLLTGDQSFYKTNSPPSDPTSAIVHFRKGIKFEAPAALSAHSLCVLSSALQKTLLRSRSSSLWYCRSCNLSESPTFEMATNNRVKLDVSLRVSPTLSLHDPQATLDVSLHVKIVESTRPGVPITIMLARSIFDVMEPGQGFDMFARGAFTALKGVDGAEGRIIVLASGFRINERLKTDELYLRESGTQFATIPGDSSEITITHHLTWDRIFKYADRVSGSGGRVRTKDELVPGEKYRIGAARKRLYVTWWCFGDLNGDLRDKKVHPWLLNSCQERDRPSDDFLRDGGWVLGEEENEDGPGLRIVVHDQDAVVEIVE